MAAVLSGPRVIEVRTGAAAPPVTGRPLTGIDDADEVDGVHLAHAATAASGNGFTATGGRVLSVVALGSTFREARAAAYAGLERIGLEGGQYRTDIAAKVAAD